MTQRQYLILIILTLMMALTAYNIGKWAESVYPQGIVPQTPTGAEPLTQAPASQEQALQPLPSETGQPRSAFTFGASMGLLGVGLLYCLIAAGLMIKARASGMKPGIFIYSVTGLAVTGFVLSYLIDDYFY